MASLRSSIFASVAFFLSINVASAGTQSCTSPKTSCSSSTGSNTCCVNSPGGILLQTQFWDTNPSIGPSNKWTIHGLWPDLCNGQYTENCDSSRNYRNITQILQSQGRTSLLNTMNQNWQSNDESNEAFWEHEWSTHGTCVSTIKPSCYNNYTPQQEVGEYFNQVVSLWSKLDTYSFLEQAGITPDDDNDYYLSDVREALSDAFGANVYLGCSNGALNQIYYYYTVTGSAITGSYHPVDATSSGNCPSTVSYPTK